MAEPFANSAPFPSGGLAAYPASLATCTPPVKNFS